MGKYGVYYKKFFTFAPQNDTRHGVLVCKILRIWCNW